MTFEKSPLELGGCVQVLFVCLGNICRSPMAEAVFRRQVAEAGYCGKIAIDSAGTGDWHIGDRPDERACRAASGRGLDLSALRARQITVEDLSRFDYILVMDEKNARDVKALGAAQHHHKVKLFLSYVENGQTCEVPDPYYGGTDGFEYALDLLEMASQGLLRHLTTELGES